MRTMFNEEVSVKKGNRTTEPGIAVKREKAKPGQCVNCKGKHNCRIPTCNQKHIGHCYFCLRAIAQHDGFKDAFSHLVHGDVIDPKQDSKYGWIACVDYQDGYKSGELLIRYKKIGDNKQEAEEIAVHLKSLRLRMENSRNELCGTKSCACGKKADWVVRIPEGLSFVCKHCIALMAGSNQDREPV